MSRISRRKLGGFKFTDRCELPASGPGKSWPSLPERTVFATMECAGNGRSFLHHVEPGVQWGAGAVGHAEWTGVPLSSVLERSKPLSDALEIICEGADSGTEPDHPEPMRFARGLPLAKALHPDTLLAFRMNGEPLTRSHGAPVRLIVPGWYGVCSVKWITRLEVLDGVFSGYFQSNKYTIRRREGARRTQGAADTHGREERDSSAWAQCHAAARRESHFWNCLGGRRGRGRCGGKRRWRRRPGEQLHWLDRKHLTPGRFGNIFGMPASPASTR